MNLTQDDKQQLLPAVAPDLVVVHWGHAEWQLRTLSERLQQWLGISAEEARGRSLRQLFPAAVPPLTELLDEVLETGQTLTGIKIRLQPQWPEFLAGIQFAGLTEDYRGQLVRVVLRQENVASRQTTGYQGILGTSPAMREVFRKIQLYGDSDAAVIITGETGSGKELVAHAVHRVSARHARPFAAVNCTAISDQLLESELFGHERGAFTGAVREHRGYFERADGGTLFLDELGDMPWATQSKLLRVLEDGQVQRVGSEKSRQVDVRVIGATNLPLEQAVADKRFRADLYHRLAVLRIHLPALRERPEDIPLLVDYFLQHFNTRYGKGIKRLTSEAMRLLQSYLWPGNVRELRNLIERIVVESETEAISARAFSEWIRERHQFSNAAEDLPAVDQVQRLPLAVPYRRSASEPAGSEPFPSALAANEKVDFSLQQLRQAYREAQGNLSAAARRLGIHRATLYRHLQRLNLSRADLD